MTGCRRFVEPHRLEPGDYTEFEGVWYAMTPDGRIANLAAHTVDVHDDWTITARPSILVRGGGREHEWHGFLERGHWRSC